LKSAQYRFGCAAMLFRHNGTQQEGALKKGMEEKSRGFTEKGSELYVKA